MNLSFIDYILVSFSVIFFGISGFIAATHRNHAKTFLIIAIVLILLAIPIHYFGEKQKINSDKSSIKKDSIFINGKLIPLDSIKNAKSEMIKQVTIPYSSLADFKESDTTKKSLLITPLKSKKNNKRSVVPTANTNLDSIRMLPFIGVKYFKHDGLTPSEYFQVHIVLANTGITPAYNFKFMTELRTSPIHHIQRVPFEGDSRGSYSGESTFLNGTEIQIHPKSFEPVSQEVYDKIISGTTKLYMRGIMRYDDIFGKPDTLTFCFEYLIERKEFAICSEGDK